MTLFLEVPPFVKVIFSHLFLLLIHKNCIVFLLSIPFSNFIYLFFFCHICTMWKFLGQMLNQHNSSNLSHSSDTARSLTSWATRELFHFSVLQTSSSFCSASPTPGIFLHLLPHLGRAFNPMCSLCSKVKISKCLSVQLLKNQLKCI